MAKATKKKDTADKEKSKSKDSKKKNESASGIAALPQFTKESWGEFKKIQWPTPKQAVNESVVVLITVVFVVGLVSIYDWASTWIIDFIINYK